MVPTLRTTRLSQFISADPATLRSISPESCARSLFVATTTFLRGRRGSHTMTQKSPDWLFGWATALNRGHNSTTRPPRKRRKNEICGEGKKREIGARPHPSIPHPASSHPSGTRFFWVRPPSLGQSPFGLPPFGPPYFFIFLIFLFFVHFFIFVCVCVCVCV